jgi:hypothetical protein
VKIFTASAAMVPGGWRDAISMRSHNVQADVIIVAASKAAAVEVLVSGGTNRGMAESVVKQSTLSRGSHSTAVRDMIAAGVLDVDQVSAFVYHHSNMDNPIARVDVAGLPVVAHFRFRDNPTATTTGLPYGIYVEPVEQ